MVNTPVAKQKHSQGLMARLLSGSIVPVLTIVVAIIVIWYVEAIFLNAPFQSDLNRLQNKAPDSWTFIQSTLNQKKPVLPAPHQVATSLWDGVFNKKITSKRSLVYHSWITLSPTLLGFGIGTIFGSLLAAGIVHVKSLEKSLMPWVIISQTIPILAIAPMIIVMFNALDITGILPKALIATYLSFFPITVGMVKGLRTPEKMYLDLMHTYNANTWQIFWKLRWPSSLPFLFASMKVAIAIALVGTIIGELPTGAEAGLGARLLLGPYYGLTLILWSALLMAAFCAAILVTFVGLAEKRVRHRMGLVS